MRLAGEVESGADVSAGGDDNVFGEPGVQSVVDVRDLVGQDVVQVAVNLVQERVADHLRHCQLLLLGHSILLHTTNTSRHVHVSV